MKVLYFIIGIIYFSSQCNAQNDVNFFMIARNTGEKVLANSDTIRVFGFAQSLSSQPNVPGPTITVNQGDSVHIDVWNVSQGAPHTIHLHGLDVDQQNDGVPMLSFDIPHMEHGYYHFKAPHAGTYLYHCHVASTIHVQAGMYGLIIVKPSDGSNTTWDGGIPYEREYAYFLSEIDTNWHVDSVLNHEHDTSNVVHSLAIPKYEPQFFLINGFSDNQLIDESIELLSAANEKNYLRLANIGFYGTRVILPSELNARIVSSDGRPLSIEELSDTVLVYPGERYGCIVESTEEYIGSIEFQYFNLNTMEVINSQYVPVKIEGFASLEKIDHEVSNFKIVPNPFTTESEVWYHLDESADVKLLIYDMQGRKVGSKKVRNCPVGDGVISFGEMLSDPGNYMITIVLGGQEMISEKVIKL
jgi:FtsP/CotA-like multicopper oxidase with cupredoxin domain